MKRSEAAVVAGFDVGPGLDQHSGDLGLAGKCRIDQRGLSALVAIIHVGALRQEFGDLARIARPRSVVERPGSHSTGDKPGNESNDESPTENPKPAGPETPDPHWEGPRQQQSPGDRHRLTLRAPLARGWT